MLSLVSGFLTFSVEPWFPSPVVPGSVVPGSTGVGSPIVFVLPASTTEVLPPSSVTITFPVEAFSTSVPPATVISAPAFLAITFVTALVNETFAAPYTVAVFPTIKAPSLFASTATSCCCPAGQVLTP